MKCEAMVGMSEHPCNVLFLCTGSLLAECAMNRLVASTFRAYSAGSQPSGKVHPFALERLDYVTRTLRSKSWEEFTPPDAPKLDFVFTVCDDAANEVCPVWPGQPMTTRWGPARPLARGGQRGGAALRLCRHAPHAEPANQHLYQPALELDRLALKQRLDEIGRVKRVISRGEAWELANSQ